MEDLVKLILIGLGIYALTKARQSRSASPTARIILQDARGTLIQDLVTGALAWV